MSAELTTTLRSAHPRGPLVPHLVRNLAGAVAALVLVIWAVTPAHYFWPGWVLIAFAYVWGLFAAIRFSRAIAHRGMRRFMLVATVTTVIVGLEVPQWMLSGFGYFWPMWSMIAGAALVGGYWKVARPSRAELEERVDELWRTRRGALDSQATELRRIERDLHDGAQARLVALSMKLGRAEERYREDAETAALLREVREDASAAIRELRELARGIAPPVLTDRGLEAAVRSLADRSGASVAVSGELVRRPAPSVEIAAYFVVAESLTNAAKHAAGAGVEVRLDERGGDLFVEVTDFGPGGADDAGGGGLTGLRQRVEALDGRLSVTSPAGVGTQVEAVLPCGW